MSTSRGRRRRTRDELAETALRLLDAHGLPDLTMRHLADALDVQPSALYWHFPSKQALLAAVSDRILAPVLHMPIDALSIPDTLVTLGTALRASLLAHRDGAELVSSSLALGLTRSPVRPRLASAAERAGASLELTRIAADTVTHFVVGYVFHEQQRLQADALGLVAQRDDAADETDIDDGVLSGDFGAALLMIIEGFAVSMTRDATSDPRRDEG